MKFVTLILALAVIGCSAGRGAAQASPPSSGTSGIVLAGDPVITLGANWYPFESYRGEHFRWVSNDAEIIIHRPTQSTVTLTLSLEGGPSLGTTQFPLAVLDSTNRKVAAANVNGRQEVSVVVPVEQGRDDVVKLHIDGGGRKVPNEKRTLNFRVFSVRDKEGGTVAAVPTGPQDIVDPRNGVTIGQNWYPLETYQGQTFRWVRNDANFSANASRDTNSKIRAIVEAGPGLGTVNFDLKLRDDRNRQVASTQAKGRAVVLFPVHLHSGENRFSLHIDGGGKPARNDPRTLNFRVFALSVLR